MILPRWRLCMKEIYNYALEVLKGRDYTVVTLSEKLEAKFGAAPSDPVG